MFEKLKTKISKNAPAWLIAGLGNPGPKYENTRHNTGFICADEIARRCGVQFGGLKMKAETAVCEISGTRCILAKPQTFMNNSGESIAKIAQFYKIPPERIIIISDDINLEAGQMRIRKKGSDGGHNGLKSIIMLLGSEDFQRIRVGVGKKPHPDYDLAAWVTGKFTREDTEKIKAAAENCFAAVEMMVSGDTEKAMSRFNTKVK